MCHNSHGGHASPQNVCDENKKETKKEKRLPCKKMFDERKDLYGCIRNPT